MSTHGLPQTLHHLVDPLLLHETPTWLQRRSDKASRRRFGRLFQDAHALSVWPRRGEIRAALAVRQLPRQAFGFPASRVHLLASPADHEAVNALSRLIAAQRFPDTELFCEPHWNLRAVVPSLQQAGFGIDGLSLAGDVFHALETIPQRAVPAPFTLRQGSNKDHDALLELRRTLFQAPDEAWRWYVGTESELTRKRARLAVTDSRFWLLEHQGQLCGYIHTAPNRNSYLGRSFAGLDVALSPEARGQGLLKVLMRTALEDLWKRGIYAYTGLSSRPEVLHVATQLARHPFRIAMRTGASLSEEYFAETYPF